MSFSLPLVFYAWLSRTPDADWTEIRPYLGVKAIAVHTEVAWRIAEADQSRGDRAVLFHKGLHCVEWLPVVEHSACGFRKLARKLTLGVQLSSSFHEQTNGKL